MNEVLETGSIDSREGIQWPLDISLLKMQLFGYYRGGDSQRTRKKYLRMIRILPSNVLFSTLTLRNVTLQTTRTTRWSTRAMARRELGQREDVPKIFGKLQH